MTPKREIRNVAASVHQRLRNLAELRKADFNYLLQRYVGERFLYRLSMSSEVDRFTLKGAALFLVWAGREFRATKDIDLLGSGPADHASIRQAIAAICAVPCPDDGFSFDPTSVRLESIQDEQDYVGVRVKLEARLGSARPRLQVDIGFGDVVTPARREDVYPTLLDHAAPRLWIYPRETSIAEKFNAMVRLGAGNTRMKDFWDVAALAQHFAFDGETLRTAIEDTFRRRETPLTVDIPDMLRPAFYEDATRLRHWDAFQRRVRAGVDAPTGFAVVCRCRGESAGVRGTGA